MQIITGKYRARKLVPVSADTTRPTLARVKESIFNLIQWDVEGSTVLDLFAGSGAYGVECISRGSKKVYFVDKEVKAVNAVKVNTRGMAEDFEIICSDFESALSSLAGRGVKFDLIFLDPPYSSDYAVRSLELIQRLNLLAEKGIIVVEHEHQNDLQNISGCYIIEKSRKYGIAYVDILMEKKG